MPKDTLLTYFIRSFGYVFWETKSIYAVLFVAIVCGGLLVERVENLDFGEGLYFAMITGLTIGYGDIVPVTFVGRLVASCLGLVGIVLTGMLVATAVHALREAIDAVHLSENR